MTTNNEPEKIDILIDQVGRLTEGLTELRLVVTEGFTELKQGLGELKEVSQRQERNIDRLVGIVEKLIERQES
jgi:hypothetical protein